MKKKINRICNVVNLINTRCQDEEFFVTDDLIRDVWDNVQITYGNDYITKSEVIRLVEMMAKYAIGPALDEIIEQDDDMENDLLPEDGNQIDEIN